MKKTIILILTNLLSANLLISSCVAQNNNLATYQPMVNAYSSLKSNFIETHLIGDWVLNTYIGNKIFKDKLHLEKDKSGNLSGTLSVPGVFTSKIENLKLNEYDIYFEIMVPEGKIPYRVKYQAKIHQSGKSFVGFVSTFENNELIGGFVSTKN